MTGRVLLLALLTVASVAPLWIARFPPLLDYPNHLAVAYLEAHLHDEAAVLQRHFSLVWRPYPNLAMQAIVLPLQRVMPIEVAGRVALSVYAALLPLAFIYLCASVRREQWWVGVAGYLFPYNVYFLMGLVNTCMGMIGAFVTLGTWLRWRERLDLRRAALLSLLLLVTYFSHLVPFVATCAAIGLHELGAGLRWRRLLVLAAALVPAAVMGAIWLATPAIATHMAVSQASPHEDSPAARVRDLLSPLHAYSRTLTFASVAVLAIVVMLALRRPFVASRGLLVACGGLLAIYATFPNYSGSSHGAASRLAFIILAMGIAMLHLEPRRPAAAAAALAALALVKQADVSRHFLALQPMLARYQRAFTWLPEGATVAPVVWLPPGTPMHAFPEGHFLSYAVIHERVYIPTTFAWPTQMPTRLAVPSDAEVPPFYVEGMTVDVDGLLARYQYLWVVHGEHMEPRIAARAALVRRDGDVALYRRR